MAAAPALHNSQVWGLATFYLAAMIIFAFLQSVLSIIFVVEPIISTHGRQVPAYLPLSIDIPETYNGVVVDPCTIEIASPGCAYNLALTTLSSQMVTFAPYTIAGVVFEPPNGTLGLPYWALRHFSDSVESTTFEEEYRQYCLPVLDPHIITCTEEPFDQVKGETISSLVRYKQLNVQETGPSGSLHPIVGDEFSPEMYKIILEYPNESPEAIKFRTNDEGQGTMSVQMHPDPDLYNTSIISSSDDAEDGYASRLHRLMYDTEPDKSDVPESSAYRFVAKCEFASIKYQDNVYSSWREVAFTLRNGVLRANVTDKRCPNPRGPDVSGFADLYFTLEGAAAVLSSSDGYSKLFNTQHEEDAGTGSRIFDNMSRLDAVVNQIYHIVHTSWSQSIHKYAMHNQTIYNKPVVMTEYPHLYVIRINWTPTTYIGLVLSILITANAYVLAGRWLRATYRFGFDRDTWNLLTPVDLMAYSLAAYQDLIQDINTVEHRRMAMRGITRTVLRERPLWEGTQQLIGLVNSNSAMQKLEGSTTANSPISPIDGKTGLPTTVKEDIAPYTP